MRSVARGPRRAAYGRPRDFAIGSTAALADGTIAKSGGMKKFAGQSVVETLQIQYAQVLVGLGIAYLSVQNRMKAKEHLKNALQQARKAPDSAQRRDVIKSCDDQLSRLKHF